MDPTWAREVLRRWLSGSLDDDATEVPGALRCLTLARMTEDLANHVVARRGDRRPLDAASVWVRGGNRHAWEAILGTAIGPAWPEDFTRPLMVNAEEQKCTAILKRIQPDEDGVIRSCADRLAKCLLVGELRRIGKPGFLSDYWGVFLNYLCEPILVESLSNYVPYQPTMQTARPDRWRWRSFVTSAVRSAPGDELGKSLLLSAGDYYDKKLMQDNGDIEGLLQQCAGQLAKYLLFSNLVRYGELRSWCKDWEHLLWFVCERYMVGSAFKRARDKAPYHWTYQERVQNTFNTVLLRTDSFTFMGVGEAVKYFGMRFVDDWCERWKEPSPLPNPPAPPEPTTPEPPDGDDLDARRLWILNRLQTCRAETNRLTGWKTIADRVQGALDQGILPTGLDKAEGGTLDDFRRAFDKTLAADAEDTLSKVLRHLQGRKATSGSSKWAAGKSQDFQSPAVLETDNWTAEELASYFHFEKTQRRKFGAMRSPDVRQLFEKKVPAALTKKLNLGSVLSEEQRDRLNGFWDFAVRFWVVHWFQLGLRRLGFARFDWKIVREWVEVLLDLVRCCELINLTYLSPETGWQDITDAFLRWREPDQDPQKVEDKFKHFYIRALTLYKDLL